MIPASSRGISFVGANSPLLIALAGCATLDEVTLAQSANIAADPLPIVFVAPAYPWDAVLLGLSMGEVTVEYVVNEVGSVEDVTIVDSTSEAFEQSAIQSAEKFMYVPSREDGKPVPVSGIRRTIEFQLNPERELGSEAAGWFEELFGDGVPFDPNMPFESKNPEERATLLILYTKLLRYHYEALESRNEELSEILDFALERINDSGYFDQQLNLIEDTAGSQVDAQQQPFQQSLPQ